jgi:KDO2-lipid IV(A) lauroyltransferase
MSPLRRLYKRSHRLRRIIRRRKDALTFHAARVALWVPRQLSLERALRLADRIGDLAYVLLSKTRRLSLEHLEVAFGDQLSAAQRTRLARASLRNAARCFVEIAKMEEIRASFEGYASVEGWENWDEVKARGRGAIVITGHIGNWELLAAYFARVGVPIAAIARRINDPRLNQLLVDFRLRNGVRPILRESPSASREIIKILNQRGLLAMLIDQDIKTTSVSVPFFGRLARTPAAAASLAVRRNLPVVPAFAQRRTEGGHRFTLLKPIYPPQSGDRRADIVEMTRQFSAILEDRIRQNPAEWVWWHKRWRRKPVPRLDLDPEIQYPKRVLQ